MLVHLHLRSEPVSHQSFSHHHRSKRIISLPYVQTTALCSRQQMMMYNGTRAVLNPTTKPGWAQVAFSSGQPRVNTQSALRNFCQRKWLQCYPGSQISSLHSWFPNVQGSFPCLVTSTWGPTCFVFSPKESDIQFVSPARPEDGVHAGPN